MPNPIDSIELLSAEAKTVLKPLAKLDILEVHKFESLLVVQQKIFGAVENESEKNSSILQFAFLIASHITQYIALPEINLQHTLLASIEATLTELIKLKDDKVIFDALLASLLNLKGLISRGLKKYDESEKAYLKAAGILERIGDNEGRGIVYSNYVFLLLDQRKGMKPPTVALDYARRAAKLFPKNVAVLNALAYAMRKAASTVETTNEKQKLWGEAAEVFEVAVGTRDSNIVTNNLAIHLIHDLKDYDRAIKLLFIVQGRNPGYVARFYLAEVFTCKAELTEDAEEKATFIEQAGKWLKEATNAVANLGYSSVYKKTRQEKIAGLEKKITELEASFKNVHALY